jgi:ACS family glucarate transporter-like MFS transporter
MGFQSSRPTRVRYGVMGYLCALAFILYVDRVCIGQAGTAMKRDLDLSDTQWGLVGGAFMVAYAICEVITGHWGDRFGSRRVLTRIVLWWSAFTALTGCVWHFSVGVGGLVFFNSFALLLLIRFLFGAGEAGALPNAARVVGNWFPPGRRGPSQALISMAAQIGGAAAPPVAAFLILQVGWRWSFVLFGSLGLVWAWLFARWFRDDPADHPAVNAAERAYITAGVPRADGHHPPIPWGQVLRSPNIWLLGVANACTAFYSYMLFFWFPTYLKEGRGAGEMTSGWLASLPLLLGAMGVMLGGFLGDWLSRQLGSRRLALRLMGSIGMTLAGLLVGSSVWADDPRQAALLCALGFFFADIQLAAWWATMGDIGGRHLGALFGFCNMIGLSGGLASQVSLGIFVDFMKSLGYSGRAQWDPAFYLFGGLLLLGATCWLFIDAQRPVLPEPPRELA